MAALQGSKLQSLGEQVENAHPMPLWTPASRRMRSPSRAAATASFRDLQLVRCRAAAHSSTGASSVQVTRKHGPYAYAQSVKQ